MSRFNRIFAGKQKGFTLIELMIAGVLGLLLLTGVVQLFLGSNRNFTLQDELAGIQEDGRFMLLFLSDQVAMAGWTDPSLSEMRAAVNFANSSDGANDAVAFTYVRPVDGVQNLDCNGNPVADGIITNVFTIANNELLCGGLGAGAAQPLIDGVESFQVLYGVETETVCPDGAVDRYMTRNEVNAAGLQDNILSVRIGLLLRSRDNLLLENNAEDFQVLDQSVDFADRRIRRLFQETVFMPNSAFNILVNSDAAVKCLSGF